MKLLDCLLQHTQRGHLVFPQARRLERALALAFGIRCGVGQRTLTRASSYTSASASGTICPCSLGR